MSRYPRQGCCETFALVLQRRWPLSSGDSSDTFSAFNLVGALWERGVSTLIQWRGVCGVVSPLSHRRALHSFTHSCPGSSQAGLGLPAGASRRHMLLAVGSEVGRVVGLNGRLRKQRCGCRVTQVHTRMHLGRSLHALHSRS